MAMIEGKFGSGAYQLAECLTMVDEWMCDDDGDDVCVCVWMRMRPKYRPVTHSESVGPPVLRSASGVSRSVLSSPPVLTQLNVCLTSILSSISDGIKTSPSLDIGIANCLTSRQPSWLQTKLPQPPLAY